MEYRWKGTAAATSATQIVYTSPPPWKPTSFHLLQSVFEAPVAMAGLYLCGHSVLWIGRAATRRDGSA